MANPRPEAKVGQELEVEGLGKQFARVPVTGKIEVGQINLCSMAQLDSYLLNPILSVAIDSGASHLVLGGHCP